MHVNFIKYDSIIKNLRFLTFKKINKKKRNEIIYISNIKVFKKEIIVYKVCLLNKMHVLESEALSLALSLGAPFKTVSMTLQHKLFGLAEID